MTPETRADKIFAKLWAGIAVELFDFVAAQIREAERGAVEWKVKEMLSEPFMLAHFCKGRDEGFAAAREKAAGIVQEPRIYPAQESVFVHIAERIREMRAE